MRIIFMGSPEFSVPTLDALLGSKHQVVAVYSQPPRRAGRGKTVQKTPVHTRAETAGIDVFTPLNFKDPAQIEAFAQLEADLAVVIAYGLILPSALLSLPRLGAVNLHASLLPRWRGAAPIHRAIMSGDQKTGVCLMQMEAGLDTGPVLDDITVDITSEMTTGDLHDELSQASAQLMMKNLDHLAELHPIAQPDTGITYAQKINKSEAKLDWTQSANELRNQIHALSPFPGAWSILDGERIKFLRVEAIGSGALAPVQPGQIMDDQMTIACGNGAIRPIEIQRDGKRAMLAADALRGWDDLVGKQMGN